VLGSLHGSRTELGLVLGARSIPNAAFILLGGVIADRLPRHAVMVTSNVVSMATQGKVAALLLTGNAEIWQLVVLSVLNGTSAAFFFPASQGIVPQTVPEAMIQQANALLRLALNPANVFGAALGGALVAAAGPGWAIAIDAASFGAAALFTSMLSLPEIVRERAPNIVHELAEGWNAFRSRAWLWSIVAQFSILNAVFVGAYAYDALGSICLVPLGLALIGPVADAIGTEATLYAAAALVIAATLPVFAVRDVRELRRK
jgi:MFS family permease